MEFHGNPSPPHQPIHRPSRLGCDSNREALWQSGPTAPARYVPSCVPDFNLNPVIHPYGGAYRPTPVKFVPTIMDRLNATGRSWELYVSGQAPYGWPRCSESGQMPSPGMSSRSVSGLRHSGVTVGSPQ